MKFAAPFALCLLCLAGCSTLIPPYERPVLPVAASYPGQQLPLDAALLAAPPTASQPVAWPLFFSDPVLQALIGRALEHNRDLRIATLNAAQTQALYQIRQADALPTVNGVLSASRAPSPAGGISSNYSVGLAVTGYELDLFGRVRSLSEAALNTYFASEEGRAAAQTSLIAAVAASYASILASNQLLEISRQALVSRRESLRLAQLRFDAGVVSALDVRQAESLLESANIAEAQQQRQRALDKNALVLLVGEPLEVTLQSAQPGTFPGGLSAQQAALVLPEVPAGLPSDLLLRRPDIRQAERQLLAANANIGAARAAFFPRIALTVSAGRASSHLSDLLPSGFWAWTLAPQLLLPIFDAGRNQAALESARVAQRIATAQYEKAIQSAFREVADALASRSTLARQQTAQQAQADAEASRLRLVDLRFQNGIASSLDLLDAQRTLFAAQQAVVQTRLAQQQNQIGLYKALGGGWEGNPTATTLPVNLLSK